MQEPLSTTTPPRGPRASTGRSRALGVIGGVFVLGYPVLVYLGLTHLRARAVALLMLVVVLGTAAWRARRTDVRALLGVPVAVCALLAVGAVVDDGRVVLALPVLVNAVLLATFGVSLRRKATPMVERFARLQKPALSEAEVRYCRSVTLVWCAFFIANGAVAGVLAARAPLAWWTLWTGALSYVAMGTLFACEWVVRRARFGAA